MPPRVDTDKVVHVESALRHAVKASRASRQYRALLAGRIESDLDQVLRQVEALGEEAARLSVLLHIAQAESAAKDAESASSRSSGKAPIILTDDFDGLLNQVPGVAERLRNVVREPERSGNRETEAG